MEKQTQGMQKQQVSRVGQRLVETELKKKGAIVMLGLPNTRRVGVVATDRDKRKTVHVWVKSSRSSRWHANIKKLRYDSNTAGQSDLLVFVDLGNKKETPTYYICPLREFAAQQCQRHDAFLKEHGGKRPRSPDSPHTLVKAEHVKQWRGRWDLFGIFG